MQICLFKLTTLVEYHLLVYTNNPICLFKLTTLVGSHLLVYANNPSGVPYASACLY